MSAEPADGFEQAAGPEPFPELRPVDPDDPTSRAPRSGGAGAGEADHVAAEGCDAGAGGAGALVAGPGESSCAADQLGPLVAALVTREGRLDPVVLDSLTRGLREAVSRLSVDGVGTRAGLAEVGGLGALAAVVAAGAQSSIAGYASRWVRADHTCPTGPTVVCPDHREGPLDPAELGALVEQGAEAGEASLGPVLRLNAGTALGRIRYAVGLTTTLSRTRDLLVAGEIDEGRAMIIAGVLHDADPQVAHAVQDVILPVAGQSSRPRLRDRVRQARGVADQAWQKRLADRAGTSGSSAPRPRTSRG